VPHLHRTLTLIRNMGAKAGAVLNPATPATMLEHVAGLLDFVLVMSVNPGFGGQTFIPHTLDKLRRVTEILPGIPIEVDGGIDASNVAHVVAAGGTIIVAGHAIFGSQDPERATRELRAAALAPAPTRA